MVVRFLFLKYLWLHLLVMMVVPLIIMGKYLDENATMFIVLWLILSALFTWFLSHWPPMEGWYRRNVSKLVGRQSDKNTTHYTQPHGLR